MTIPSITRQLLLMWIFSSSLESWDQDLAQYVPLNNTRNVPLRISWCRMALGWPFAAVLFATLFMCSRQDAQEPPISLLSNWYHCWKFNRQWHRAAHTGDAPPSSWPPGEDCECDPGGNQLALSLLENTLKVHPKSTSTKMNRYLCCIGSSSSYGYFWGWMEPMYEP